MTDTSKKFIKMCERAPKIQEAWKPAEGDYVFRKVKDYIDLIVDTPESGHLAFTSIGEEWRGGDTYSCDAYELIEDFMWRHLIWLPDQSQLQEMVCDKQRLQMPGFIVNDLNCWCYKNMLANYTSMEQLWLAFVMKEVHNKVWIEEKWVKAEL